MNQTPFDQQRGKSAVLVVQILESITSEYLLRAVMLHEGGAQLLHQNDAGALLAPAKARHG